MSIALSFRPVWQFLTGIFFIEQINNTKHNHKDISQIARQYYSQDKFNRNTNPGTIQNKAFSPVHTGEGSISSKQYYLIHDTTYSWHLGKLGIGGEGGRGDEKGPRKEGKRGGGSEQKTRWSGYLHIEPASSYSTLRPSHKHQSNLTKFCRISSDIVCSHM